MDKILNPKSGKHVLKTGRIGKKLVEEEKKQTNLVNSIETIIPDNNINNINNNNSKNIIVKTNIIRPLTGIIYLYVHQQTKKPLYVGQSRDFNRRHLNHFNGHDNKITSNIKLREIGEENIETIILHQKIFNITDYANEIDMITDYGKWANELEMKEIENHNTYNDLDGFNYTKGSQGNKEKSFHESQHKKSFLNFEKFIKAAKIFKTYEGNPILGSCRRTQKIKEMDDYPLGEELHKFRCNEYTSIWCNENYVKQLNEVGYTKSHKEANINRLERTQITAYNSRWLKIKPILEWIYEKYGHINFPQGKENPIDFPNELLKGLNYKKISNIINDFRKQIRLEKTNKPLYINKTEQYECLTKFNFFENDYDFVTDKIEKSLDYFYNNEKYDLPSTVYTIPNNDSVNPKYICGFTLGITLYTRKRCEKGLSKIMINLIEQNKDKHKYNHADKYNNNKEKKDNMVKKLQESMKKTLEHNPNHYILRSWLRVLKKPIVILELKIGKMNLSDFYMVSISPFSLNKKELKPFNKQYNISQFSNKKECYKAANNFLLKFHYMRIWYILTNIEKLLIVKKPCDKKDKVICEICGANINFKYLIQHKKSKKCMNTK